MEYDFVNAFNVIGELAMNVERHYKEMLDSESELLPNIDWEHYRTISNMGVCKALTMRDNGKLVGYAVFTISTNPRHKDVLEAFCDGIFIEKEYRGKHSLMLFKKIDEYMKSFDVKEVHFLIDNEKIGRFLSKNGYNETKTLWSLKYE